MGEIEEENSDLASFVGSLFFCNINSLGVFQNLSYGNDSFLVFVFFSINVLEFHINKWSDEKIKINLC